MEELKPLFDQLKAPSWKQFLKKLEEAEETQIWLHSTNGVGDEMLLVAAEDEELAVSNAVGTTSLATSLLSELWATFPRSKTRRSLRLPPKP